MKDTMSKIKASTKIESGVMTLKAIAAAHPPRVLWRCARRWYKEGRPWAPEHRLGHGYHTPKACKTRASGPFQARAVMSRRRGSSPASLHKWVARIWSVGA